MLTSNFDAKFEYISQAKQIDYREVCLGKHDNGDVSKYTNPEGLTNGHTHKDAADSQSELDKNFNSESLLANNFRHAISKSATGSRCKLPWVKDHSDDSEKSNPMCDIVSVKQLPSATFVTIQDDSDDSMENTTDDSITEEIILSNLNYVNGHAGNEYTRTSNSTGNHSPTSDSLTDKTTSSSDLIEAHLAITPKNEREVMYY